MIYNLDGFNKIASETLTKDTFHLLSKINQ